MMPVSGEQARMKPPPPRALLALSGADLAAQSAEQLSLAAVPIVAVLVLGAGPGDIGLLATAQTPSVCWRRWALWVPSAPWASALLRLPWQSVNSSKTVRN